MSLNVLLDLRFVRRIKRNSLPVFARQKPIPLDKILSLFHYVSAVIFYNVA